MDEWMDGWMADPSRLTTNSLLVEASHTLWVYTHTRHTLNLPCASDISRKAVDSSQVVSRRGLMHSSSSAVVFSSHWVEITSPLESRVSHWPTGGSAASFSHHASSRLILGLWLPSLLEFFLALLAACWRRLVQLIIARINTLQDKGSVRHFE